MNAPAYRGRFVWFDYMAKDKGGAVDFYTQLLGWGTEEWEGAPAGQPCTMWKNGDAPIGGVIPMAGKAPEGSPPHWIAYIGTPGVDDTAEQATKLGGTVLHAPEDIPTVGRFAVIADPQGAAISIFTPESEAPGLAGPPAVGEISWHELATTDYEAAFDFYRGLFGWEQRDRVEMGEAGVYLIYGRPQDDFPLGGIFNKMTEMPGPPAWLYYVRVPDVKETARRVGELGGQMLNGPMEVPGGDLIAHCLDPQGGAFAIHSTSS